MGRQAYLNRLALGRSPYEPPDTATVDPSSPVRRVSSYHADNYMQQYDARGHPVNPQSKVLGRELRRAKNDILSTMGVVVSGEDRKAGSSSEQQKIEEIATENDFGLIITTLDQLSVLFGTWWTASLAERVQTYKHYTHAALLEVIRSERGSTGMIGFYLAGLPAWMVSTGLAIARDKPLKRFFATARDYFLSLTGSRGLSLGIRSLFGLAYTVARSSFLLVSVEAHMYFLLQSLSLVPSHAIPSLRLLIPFGDESLLQLPPLPTDLSFHSTGGFLFQFLTSPGVLTFLFAFYLRPELEERIYRLIRRQLPKPTLVDEHSIKIAYEENLIDWIVPTLGRRSAEEMSRANLTTFEDIKYELASLRNWVFSLFGLLPGSQNLDPLAVDYTVRENLESLRTSIESLQQELDEMQPRNGPPGIEAEFSQTRPLGRLTSRSTIDVANPNLPMVAEPTPVSASDLALAMPQVLMNENRMSQSPGEMSSDYFSEMATLGRTSAHSSETVSQSSPNNPQTIEGAARERQSSRSNTLFSRPSSPETSPPTSPRVRASLIHQSSDIITMQLELLGNRNRTARSQTPNPNLLPRGSADHRGLLSSSSTSDRRSIADFLEALIMSQAQRQATQRTSQATNGSRSHPTRRTSFATTHEVLPAEGEQPNLVQNAIAAEHPSLNTVGETPTSTTMNVLPDRVEVSNVGGTEINPSEEPNDYPVIPSGDLLDSLAENQRATAQPPANQPLVAHRVTLLSSYPVDSLASHLAAVISTIILSPLETLCLRSLAHSYLSTHDSPNAQLSDLHPLNLWLGGRSWSDRAAYAGRIALVRGMQAALRAGIWGFFVGSTMRIGRKFCGWGTL